MHGVLGASLEGLLAVEAALRPDRRLFFLRDYSSLCASPRLLRNDVAYCGAPPPNSEACAICVHVEARRALLAGLERLFERCRFTIVAPSQAALALWRGATALPYEAATVVEPASLEELAQPAEIGEEGEIGAEGRPVRVAFLGAPSLVNGWLTFESLLEACGELTAYAFHHFAAAEDLRPSRNLVSIEADRPLRDLMIAARVDFVVMASESPEPFSAPALEALAGGSDLVALRRSGHPAALVESERRGRLFESDDEIVEFFVTGKAIAYARERGRFPRHVQAVRGRDALAALLA